MRQHSSGDVPLGACGLDKFAKPSCGAIAEQRALAGLIQRRAGRAAVRRTAAQPVPPNLYRAPSQAKLARALKQRGALQRDNSAHRSAANTGRSSGADNMNMQVLKNIVFKYMISDEGGEERAQLVSVIGGLLNFSPPEMRRVGPRPGFWDSIASG